MRKVLNISIMLVVIFLLLLSACSVPPVAPTVTPANTAAPTKTATPTKVPLSYEVPVTDDGRLDQAKISNLVPEDPLRRQEMYREVKAELVLKISDATKMGCDMGRYLRSTVPATSLELLCFSLMPSGSIVPQFVARDSNGNVVLTFLVYFGDNEFDYESRVPQLLNLKMVEEEMEQAVWDNLRYPATWIPDLAWGNGNSMWVWFAGNINPAYTVGQYPQIDETSRVLTDEGFKDTYWATPILEFNTDTVIFAVYGAICTWVDS